MVYSFSLWRVVSEVVKQWNVVVIGGGVAGAAAAAKLADGGKSVLLLEKERAAHHKVCGEFISIEAQHYLSKLGIDVAALGAAPINRIRLVHGERVICTHLPFEAFSLSRRLLDEALLLRAEACGAEVRRGTIVSRISRESTGWRVALVGGGSILADNLFLATGKHDLREVHRARGTQNDFIGFKLHLRLRPRQTAKLAGHVELMLFDGGYAGLEPVEDELANLCLIVTKARFAACGKNWNGLLDALLRETPPLAEKLEGGDPCWQKPLSVFGIPYGFVYRAESDATPGLYRLGDQMAVIPSFSGDGIAIALCTAFVASECYIRNETAVYHRRMYAKLFPQIRHAALLSKIITFPPLRKGVMMACGLAPGIIRTVVTRTRLTDATVC